MTFLDGTTTLGTGMLSATGTATYATSALAVGAHSITAAYAGAAGFAASTSSAVSVTITAVPATFSLGSVARNRHGQQRRQCNYHDYDHAGGRI